MPDILPFLIVAIDPLGIFTRSHVRLEGVEMYLEELHERKPDHMLFADNAHAPSWRQAHMQMEALAECNRFLEDGAYS